MGRWDFAVYRERKFWGMVIMMFITIIACCVSQIFGVWATPSIGGAWLLRSRVWDNTLLKDSASATYPAFNPERRNNDIARADVQKLIASCSIKV